VDSVSAVFEEKQRDSPGRIWGLPKGSVFEGIDDDVQREAVNVPAAPTVNGSTTTSASSSSSTIIGHTNGVMGRGKSKAHRLDEMDVG
jgi:transcriptional adapter 3